MNKFKSLILLSFLYLGSQVGFSGEKSGFVEIVVSQGWNPAENHPIQQAREEVEVLGAQHNLQLNLFQLFEIDLAQQLAES